MDLCPDAARPKALRLPGRYNSSQPAWIRVLRLASPACWRRALLGSRRRLIGLLAVAVSLLAAGCYGPYRVTPDEGPGAGGLKPTLDDREAGRVGIASGLDLKAYRVVAVARFPVVDPSVKDGAERELAEA